MLIFVFCFFKQKTAYEMRISDWSSDVCSSDLAGEAGLGAARRTAGRALQVGQGGRGTAGVAIDHDGEFFERCHQAASSRPWRALLMSLMVARSSRPVFICPARSYWMRKSLICAFFDFFARLALAIVDWSVASLGVASPLPRGVGSY